MPRSISWESRLNQMHAQVERSSTNPYGRAAVAKLFGVEAATAKKLIALMPRDAIGSSLVVQREDLLAFLNQCMDAEDLRAHLDVIRKAPPKTNRRKLRLQLPRPVEEKLSTLRELGIWIERGKLTVYFTTLDDFGTKFLQVAESMQSPEFERRYCDPLPAHQAPAREAAIAQDVEWIKAERQFMRSIFDGEQSSARGDRKLTDKMYKQACAAFAEMQRICERDGRELDPVYVRAHATICGVDSAAARTPILDSDELSTSSSI